jgi:hypothetical protein
MALPSDSVDLETMIGIWVLDEDYQITRLLFRSDGRYHLQTQSTDANLDFASAERGRYEVSGHILSLASDDYYGEVQPKRYELVSEGDTLSLTRMEYDYTQVYRFEPNSRAHVLEAEKVTPDLVRTWQRSIAFSGTTEYTFRPDGYYFQKNTPSDAQFPPEFIRGRYVQDGLRLTLSPYSGTTVQYDLDFFGGTVTFITKEEFRGESVPYEERPNSGNEIHAKVTAAEQFLSRADWQVGLWEIRDAIHSVDLTLRPDGYYIAQEYTESLAGIVRGRYTLENRRIVLSPFVGQGIYARSNGEFGQVERTRALDFYEDELQFIDLEAISQSVTIARKRPASDAAVMEKVRAAALERQRLDWHIGVWETNDAAGWMQFTWRPDGRYTAMTGDNRTPAAVERGRYRLTTRKATLAPYPGLGPPRGFELDFYDGDLFLIGDLSRMVVARKNADSAQAVIDSTREPIALNGERGSILGLWTANLPGNAKALTFRPDGEFRLRQCLGNALAFDYGLYAADMSARTLVSDSRFIERQDCGLDFYGDTMTIYGGTQPPSTYAVNLGAVDAAIAASLAADAEDARVDASWMDRVPLGPKRPDAVHVPTADIPADPQPGHVFEDATIFAGFQLYRRLTPGFVYFNVQGVIRSVPVVNTSEWHFFPTGRTLVRFKNYRAGISYPSTIADVSDAWGAYRVDGKPSERDVLHRYADNAVHIETDAGETSALTLEDGRRHLFLGKTFQILSDWAAEQRPMPCEAPSALDLHLLNTGISLSSTVPADELEERPPVQVDEDGREESDPEC